MQGKHNLLNLCDRLIDQVSPKAIADGTAATISQQSGSLIAFSKLGTCHCKICLLHWRARRQTQVKFSGNFYPLLSVQNFCRQTTENICQR